MKKLFALAVALMASTALAGVDNSLHNMNTFTGGSADVCYYCHAAHNTTMNAAPLWARNAGTASMTYYSSNSISANITSLDVISSACMSCHDGSTDVGVTIKGDLTASTFKVTGAALLDVLTNDHPVSLTWDSSKAGLGAAPANANFKLYSNVITCGTCHAVHDNTIQKFLRVDPGATAFCASCHVSK